MAQSYARRPVPASRRMSIQSSGLESPGAPIGRWYSLVDRVGVVPVTSATRLDCPAITKDPPWHDQVWPSRPRHALWLLDARGAITCGPRGCERCERGAPRGSVPRRLACRAAGGVFPRFPFFFPPCPPRGPGPPGAAWSHRDRAARRRARLWVHSTRRWREMEAEQQEA